MPILVTAIATVQAEECSPILKHTHRSFDYNSLERFAVVSEVISSANKIYCLHTATLCLSTVQNILILGPVIIEHALLVHSEKVPQ